MAYALLLEYIEGLTLHQLLEGEEFQKTKEHMDPKVFSQACNMVRSFEPRYFSQVKFLNELLILVQACHEKLGPVSCYRFL